MRITKIRTHRFSPAEIEKLDIVLDLLSQAVNSAEFNRTIQEHEQFETGDRLSNEEIFNFIMSGNEADTNEGVDNEADLNLTLDLRNSTDAIGYTKQERIFTFQNFFHQLQPTKLAGHYAHEYCHTLGFADPSDLSDISKNVPYEVGRIVEEISIRNHRTFIIVDENLSDNQRVAAMDNFRNATIITGETDTPAVPATAIRISSTAKVKAQKPTPVKKAAGKKAVPKKKRKPVSKRKKTVVKKKKTAKKISKKKVVKKKQARKRAPRKK